MTDKDGNIVCSRYMSNSGNPVPLMREFLLEVYTRFPQAKICACAATGSASHTARAARMMICLLFCIIFKNSVQAVSHQVVSCKYRIF